jgi:hypothetical protein
MWGFTIARIIWQGWQYHEPPTAFRLIDTRTVSLRGAAEGCACGAVPLPMLLARADVIK